MSDVSSIRAEPKKTQSGTKSARKTQITSADSIRLAVALMNARKLEQAERVCRQIVRTRPKWAEAHSVLGAIKFQQGETEAAIRSVQQAIKLSDAVAKYHANLGEMLRQDGQIDSAIISLHRATNLDPKLTYAFNNLGIAYFDKSEFEYAIEMFRKTIALDSNYPEAYNNLGKTMVQLGKDKEAAECFAKAIELCVLTMIRNNKYTVQEPTLGEPSNKKWLFLARGAPGAGKTTFFQDLGLNRFVIDTDQLRSEIGSSYHIVEGKQRQWFYDEVKVRALLYDEIKKRMQCNEPIIVDATFQHLINIVNPLIIAKNFGYSAMIIDFTMIPEETARLRNERRKSQKYVLPESISDAYRNFRREPLPKSAISIPYLSFAESKLCRMMQNELQFGRTGEKTLPGSGKTDASPL